MKLQTQQFKLLQENPSIFQASPCRDEHVAVWVMQKPSWRPVWLHQHLHPTLWGCLVPACHVRGQCPVPRCLCLWPEPVRAPATTNPAAWQNSGTHGARAGG